MEAAGIMVAAYGVLTLVGGLIGYLKARSAASLIAGSIAGALLLVCAAGMRNEQPAAWAGSAVIALALGVRFFGGWRRKRRLMPDLVMAVFSALTLLLVAAGWLAR